MKVDCELQYYGDANLRLMAQQCAQIVAASYEQNGIGAAGHHWMGVPPAAIHISDKGGLEISHRDGQHIYTAGMAMVTGMLGGIGLGLGKKVTVDPKGPHGDYMSPVGAAVRFESFADLVDAVNVLGKSLDLEAVNRSALALRGARPAPK